MLYSLPSGSRAESPTVKQEEADTLKFAHLGFTFAATLALCICLGFYLDRKWETLPLFTLLGCMGGFAAAFYHLYLSVYGASGTPDKNDSDD